VMGGGLPARLGQLPATELLYCWSTEAMPLAASPMAVAGGVWPRMAFSRPLRPPLSAGSHATPVEAVSSGHACHP
jgi:hypothetical protein